jgi:DNA end-binding protein Ku
MRSSLNVTLGFGLASIPVGLAKLIDDDDSVEFRTLHASCSTPVVEKKWCPLCNVEVTPDDQLKGYEVSKAEYVLFTPDEVAASKPVSDGVVKLTKFVPEEQMPERHQWLKHYIVIPDKVMGDRYGALLDSLVGTGLAGVGQSVLWKKRRTCFVYPERFGRYLLLSTVSQAIQKTPDFDPPSYPDEDLLTLTTALIVNMSGQIQLEDTIAEDPVRLMVETRLGVKRKRQAEVKVSAVGDYQQQLRASMQTKKSKTRVKVK